MRLSQTAEYALRVAACMVRHENGAYTKSAEIADSSGVPHDYLSKIMRRLVEAGVLESRKGRGGGFRLAKAPDAITFMDVLSAVGFESQAGQCAFGWDQCSEEEPCPLHPFWSRLRWGIDDWASSNTLADFLTQDAVKAALTLP